MSFNVKTAKLCGNPDSFGWSQAYDFKPRDSEKLALRGHLFVLISIFYQEEGVDTVLAGREVISRLHEEYFGKTQEKPFIALKNALEKVIDEFSSQEKIEIAAVALIDSTVYTAVGGGAFVFLFRGSKLYKLAKSAEGQVKAASGKPSDKDKIIFGTRSFFNSFSAEAVKKSLNTNDPADAVESFAPFVHSQKSGGGCGVFILQFDRYENTQKIKPLLGRDKEKRNILQDKFYTDPRETFKKVRRGFLNVLKKSKDERVYLKKDDLEQSPRKRKTSLLVGILLLLILSVSIFFGIQQKRKLDFKSTYESQLTSAEHELRESYNLYLLNPQRSRELFDQARSKVLGLSTQKIDDPNLEILKEKIKEGEEKILGQYNINPQLFVDLALFSEGFSANEITVSSDTAYILDKTGKKIIKITLSNKRTETYAGPSDVQNSETFAAYMGRVFVSSSDGLYELDNGRLKIADNSKGSVFIAAYAGNLYVLDKSESKIYRYPAAKTGFGTKSEWLRVGTQVNLSDAQSMVIDGMIWMVTGQNKIMKLSLGNLQNFEFKGVFPEIEIITDIFTNEDCEFLYLLENDKERVVVVGKSGEYKAQYLGEGIKEAIRLVVSEKEKKAFLLTTDKLLYFDLKHLN